MTAEENYVETDFEHWAIVELMGHVRMTGRVTEVERFGSKLGKIDVIDKAGVTIATQLFGGGSVYRITLCTEQTAKDMARDATCIGPDVPWNLRDSIRTDAEEDFKARHPQIEAKPDVPRYGVWDSDFEPDEPGP